MATTHDSFTLERVYPVAPSRVFDAFAIESAKAAWFGGMDGWTLLERVFEFREGGRERVAGRWDTGMVTQFDAVYFDIIPGERIVYAYEMHLDGRKISVSLATVEIAAAGAGARLTITEQGAFLNGYDDEGSRDRGTQMLMDRLGASLQD
jgi:uncharacterized protein YndB with AHSA1/START domain